jgi:protoporphyrin/coproporphyrin ferrochelatase
MITDMGSTRSENDRWGVLLLAHGAPEKLGEIPEFLLHVRSGRKLPDAAVQEIIRRYSLIGGGSPLLRLTNLQAEALMKRLGHPVYVGMRNWKPFIADSVRRIASEGIERVVAVCLAPQNSCTSIGMYRKSLTEAIGKLVTQLQFDFVESWHDHPGLIAAFGEKLRIALSQVKGETSQPVPVIFTAHSVPVKTITEGDPYEQEVRETASRVAGLVMLKEYRLAFQSQGMTSEPWLGPSVESQIDKVAQAGHRYVLLAPIGFVSDHLEILYDIDIGFREYAKSKGVILWRSESLNDSALFIDALAAIVSGRAERKPVGSGR